ncbi:MAG TPA: NADH-quinone oxidoreductase subunit NuoF [Candidatus Binatia bacterium]|nr:NADH-quinone oxidoreductase subunit NuoF [Candidatus Binatia bacterium]
MTHNPVSPPSKPLTRNIEAGRGPLDITEYEKRGGYHAVRKALQQMAPLEVTHLVKAANLRGRGGAGFPTGVKWGLTAMDKAGEKTYAHKYFVANGDEMEPGTFKDRLLLEGDPHSFVEGMILGAYAVQADIGYVFLRNEYFLAAERVQKAIDEAYDKGYLGQDILGSGFSHDLYLHTSAGRYICGEETALISSLEGRRAMPRAKPPFPGVSGLFGKPTVVNNIETICNVGPILQYGADWFRSLSKSGDGGTKLYGCSGKVKRPGTFELPMGVTAREILEEHAGGMRDGLRLKAWLPGGASTDFLTPAHLDLPMDFDSIARAGSRMGTGQMLAVDDRTSMVGLVRNLQHFFAQESCGWCTPCRDGLPWGEKLLIEIENGRGKPGDLELLAKHTRLLGPGRTFCAHAPGAMEPLQSALKYFRAEFEAGIAKPAEKVA